MKWLRERLTTYPRALMVLYVVSFIVIFASALWSPSGLTDFMGYPLGRDFSQYWLASSMSLAGDPSAVYNITQFQGALQDHFKTSSLYAWFYPPTFLLLIYPLALLPYFVSLSFWLGMTLIGYLAVLRRIAPHPLSIWLALTFPGTYENIMYGQNGFLSASLIGGGLLLLDLYPIVGGCLLGLVSYKPNLLPLLVVALVAGRRWKALLAALLAILALASASYLVFGEKVWLAFFHSLFTPVKLMQNQAVPPYKMITIFAAALFYGAGPRLAWALQVGASLGIAALVALLWFREARFPIRASALVLGILLVTPYAWPYDLAILALPLAWLAQEGLTNGWHLWEPALLFVGWLTPLLVITLNLIGMNFFGPIMLLALFILVWRRSADGFNLN